MIKVIDQFLQWESASGILLFLAALAALVLSNSPLEIFYQKLWEVPLTVHIGHYTLARPFLFWVNEGLMTLFFLLIGLELKRAFVEGEMSSFPQIALPTIAAIGGMVVPVLLFCSFNWRHPVALSGWAVPMATDIAFALGVLSLFGKRVPLGLKLFLMALAIFDDLGAIIVIAIFYTQALSWMALLLACACALLLMIMNRLGVQRLRFYLLAGLVLWVCVLKSGVHPTVAGVLLAFFIPLRKKGQEGVSSLHRLENVLHPWVAYFIMPLFAFANAGLPVHAISASVFSDSLVVGIVLGLFLGKQLGVFSFAWLAIKLGLAKLPAQTTGFELYGVAILCGIGFTMSLFLGTLTFQANNPAYLLEVRLSVLLGSVLSGVVGAVMLRRALVSKPQ